MQPATEHLEYTGWRRWDNCFIRLLDGMLQAGALGSTDYQLRIPTKIRQIEILDAKPRLPSGSESEPIAIHCLLPSCPMHRLSIICTGQLLWWHLINQASAGWACSLQQCACTLHSLGALLQCAVQYPRVGAPWVLCSLQQAYGVQ